MAIFHQVRNQCDLIWLENLNLRGGFKKDIMDYIRKKYSDLVSLYDAIYNKGDRSYFRSLEDRAERLAKENSCPFVDNELPYGRAEPGHPVIVDYFYHEEVLKSVLREQNHSQHHVPSIAFDRYSITVEISIISHEFPQFYKLP